jgi:MFS family permease
LRTIVVGTFWVSLGILLFVVSPNVWLIVAGLVTFGLLNPALNSSVIGYRTAVTPDRLQGCVNGVARLMAQAAAPLGPLVAGALLSTISARATVLAFAALMTALAVAATVAPSIREAPSLAELAADVAA